MTSIDHYLPFLLQRDNVARYENGVVYIGDRRQYPFAKSFVRCETVEDIARAIEMMVTQGGGPWVAAAFALALAAREVEDHQPERVRAHLESARRRLVSTRPTNTAMARRLSDAMVAAEAALATSQSVENAILDWLNVLRDKSYADYAYRARLGADLIADGDGILTMCFAETAFIVALAMASQEDGKEFRVYTPETRPYLQGARLTAPCIHELGIPVQVIGDSMPAYVMSQEKIHKYFTAADLITLDGHVVNKIGTFQNAIAAHHHRIPYFVFAWGVDRERPDRASIEIEERDPAEMRMCRGTPTTIDAIDAYYPAFDITPPHLVAGVITRYGILSPYDLHRHFA